MVFWGDHLPPQIYPQSLFKKEGERAMHETPFLIWSNGKPLKHTTLPTTSPIQFLPHLFDAENAPIPPWYALLDTLDKQIPAMDAGMYINSQDQLVKKAQLTPEAKKALVRLPDDHVRPEHREALQREDDVRRRACVLTGRVRRSRGTASGSAPAGGSPSASSGCPWGPGSCRAGPRSPVPRAAHLTAA